LEQEVISAELSMQTLEKKVNAEKEIYQSKHNEYLKLKQEFEDARREKDGLEKEKEKLTSQISKNEADKSQLNAKVDELNTKFKEKSSELDTLKSNIKDITLKIENSEKHLIDMKSQIESETSELEDFTMSADNQYKILQIFLKEGYIKDPRYDVIKVVNQPGIKNFDQLVMTSGVGRDVVKQTLKDFVALGKVEFDESNGIFTVLSKMDV